MPRRCGTPGCELNDGHVGLCTSQHVEATRKRIAVQEIPGIQREQRTRVDIALDAFRTAVADRSSVATPPVADACWVFVAESEGCGNGLYARADLKKGQALCQYGGPRLPLKLMSGRGYEL